MTQQTREEIIDYLTSDIGHERAEAERMLVDDDLWIVDPALRYGFTGEEAVREWSKALTFAKFLAEGFAAGPPYSPGGFGLEFQGAIQQMLWDMRERAEEALRRAEERVKA
jgi:hypothetical protein